MADIIFCECSERATHIETRCFTDGDRRDMPPTCVDCTRKEIARDLELHTAKSIRVKLPNGMVCKYRPLKVAP